MNLPHRLDQPPVSRLGRTGLVFLGSIALAHHALPPLKAQSQPTPATSQSTGSDRPNERVRGNYRQGATEHADTRFLTDVEAILRRQLELSETAVQHGGELASLARDIVQTQPEIARELSALATKRKVKLAATAAGDRPMQPLFDPRSPDFQSKYLTQMEQDQTRAVALFEAARNSNDNEIRQFAEKHLALQQERLDRLHQLQGTKRRR